jgi:AAA domain, putative AbiEii toxin, Type IV TA system
MPIMPEDLILNSLEIQRFRCFRELRIERLGRVNLIVGKNNVGKSTVLEALRLFASPSSLDVLFEILASRDELSRAEIDSWKSKPGSPIPLDGLFFGRQGPTGQGGAILIGPSDSPEKSLEVTIEDENVIWKFEWLDDNNTQGNSARVPAFNSYHRIRWLVFRIESATRIYPVGMHLFQGPHANPGVSSASSTRGESLNTPIRELPHFAVGPSGLDPRLEGQLWDKVSLSPLEEDIVAALDIISPGVERVAMKAARGDVEGLTPAGGTANRIAFVKVESFEEPIPLRALGDGMNRLFGMALGLVHAKGGLLLIDEIENGIHYSVQADLWRLIFETAARLNVQVFATTHSYDCIKAFEAAARESDEEGILVRLARKGDRTLVGEFDERELEIAVQGEIEVR